MFLCKNRKWVNTQFFQTISRGRNRKHAGNVCVWKTEEFDFIRMALRGEHTWVCFYEASIVVNSSHLAFSDHGTFAVVKIERETNWLSVVSVAFFMLVTLVLFFMYRKLSSLTLKNIILFILTGQCTTFLQATSETVFLTQSITVASRTHASTLNMVSSTLCWHDPSYLQLTLVL